jgi:arylsulfatase A-like enzyme
MWANRYDRFEGKPIYQKKLRRLEYSRRAGSSPADWDEELRALLACCFSYLELIDEMVGQVVETLKELGLYERTAIIFTADHGDMAGAHGYVSKGAYMYDEIYRIPLLLKPPAGSAARRLSVPVHLMDVTATCLHWISGGEQDSMGGRALHGRSLLPLVDGSAQWPREVHYAEYHGDWYGHYSARMVTDGRWKLVWNLSDLCELYDLESDPAELENLFYEPNHAQVRRRYLDAMVEEARRVGDAHLRLLSSENEELLAQALHGALPVGF